MVVYIFLNEKCSTDLSIFQLYVQEVKVSEDSKLLL